MSFLGVVGLIAWAIVSFFILLMWVRAITQLIASLARGWHPRGIALFVAEVSFTITDPPIKLMRRLIPNIRIGSISLDIAWMLVLIVAMILSNLASVLSRSAL